MTMQSIIGSKRCTISVLSFLPSDSSAEHGGGGVIIDALDLFLARIVNAAVMDRLDEIKGRANQTSCAPVAGRQL